MFAWLGRYPWRSVTWLGHGHTARWRADAFPMGLDYQGVLMLAEPLGFPDMSGFAFGGEPVRWLWLFPLTEAELRFTAEQGHEALAARLAVRHRC